MNQTRTLSYPFWIFIFALSFRFLIFLQFTDSIYFLPEGSDMKFYADWGSKVARGELTDSRAFYGLPGYPFFLGGIFALFGFSPFIVGVLQVFSESLIAVLIFWLGCRIAEGKTGQIAGAVAAAGWVFYQPAQAFSMILMPTTWLVLAFWGIVAWCLKTEKCEPFSFWKPWLWMGLVIGFVSMFVATILFAIPLPAAAAFAQFRRRPAIWLASLVILITGVFAGSSPCWMHNFFIAKERVFLSAHSGINFWIGNNPTSNGYPNMPPGIRASQSGMLVDSMLRAEEAVGRPLTRVEISRFWSDKAHAYIRENPKAWLSLMLLKMRYIGNAFQYDDLTIITPMRDDGILPPGLGFGLAAALAIPGAFFSLGRYPRARWIAAATALHFAALLPVFITERYRLAAVPGLLLLGSLGLVRVIEALRNRTPNAQVQFSAYIAIALAGSLFVWYPINQPSLKSLEDYNTGLKALESGQIDKAQQRLEAAFVKGPHNAEINFALGNLWLARKDTKRAREFYENALKLNPEVDGAFNNIGVICVMERDWVNAQEYFSLALAKDPNNLKNLYLLASAQYGGGESDAARKTLEQALAIDPKQSRLNDLQKAIETGEPYYPFDKP